MVVFNLKQNLPLPPAPNHFLSVPAPPIFLFQKKVQSARTAMRGSLGTDSQRLSEVRFWNALGSWDFKAEL